MKLPIVVLAFCAAVGPAFALEKEFVDRMVQHASNVERDASAVNSVFRAKAFDSSDAKQKVDTMGADIAKLQELVSQYESTHSQLSDRDAADWKLVKDKVQLLTIFHERKKELMADPAKNRGLIRAHASGVAQRAQKLQQTLSRLRRG